MSSVACFSLLLPAFVYNVRVIAARSLSFNLEPTFRCNLQCPMCPRFSSEDPHLDMSAQTYERISEQMSLAHTVDFTGWGEPLLHPRIYEMIRAAKERGCATTMTSNGTALNERNSTRLIESGLDVLTVSVDGGAPETYNRIRMGADFDKLSVKLKTITRLTKAAHSRLDLGIAFTIQEENAGDLDAFVPWVISVGARTLHLKHLNAVSTADDWQRSFLKYKLHPCCPDNGRLQRVEETIGQVRLQAEKAGIRFLMHSESPMSGNLEGRHCLATPLLSVYFSYEGRVSPCCHFGHHVSRFFDGRFIEPSSMFLGDIRIEDLDKIWLREDYRSFRDGFQSGNFPEACKTCYLLYGK